MKRLSRHSTYIGFFVFGATGLFSPLAWPATLSIPQIPLIMASPTHPQVLMAIGNSESMDGNLSGAIMAGSGSLSSALASLSNSSSPLNYLVPAGFIPPVQAANSSGLAPYTVIQNTNKVDNSPSRLNIAKAGIQGIIETFMQSTDFALETYSISGVTPYTTWVYYMSGQNANFSFTNTPVAGSRYVPNPCYNYSAASSTVGSNCSSIASLYSAGVVSGSKYMNIAASSDDPAINDILYASGLPAVFNTYTGPSPATPFPPNFSLSNYNSGNIVLSYSASSPNIGSFGTGPTNAGFVPYSKQVMYAQRGFGYYGTQSASTGNVVVPMTTAGTYPTTSSINNAINTFLPYLKPETNSSSTTEIKAAAVQAPIAGLLTRANSYFSTLNATSGNGCPQKKYVVLISDGLPTQDLTGKRWPPLGSASALGYGVTATFNTDGSLNATNARALTDAINTLTTLKNNSILTYIIGLGAGVDPTVNPAAAASLTAMAVAGGTTNYYPATSTIDLINNLNSIMISIQNGSFETSAASVSSTHINANSVEYQANFVSNDTPYQDWTGNLFATPLNPITGAPTNTITWSAKTLLDALAAGTGWSSNRFIATWDPVPVNPATTGAGIPFRWANLSAAQKALLQPSDTLGQSRLEYLRGKTTFEKRNGGTFRNRSHILGDVINSQVKYVGAPKGPYLSSSYTAFVTAKSNRQAMLYVGANDGMLHAFNADTGGEVFAFIPSAVFANLINLTVPIYNVSHRFFVDGSPQSADVQFSDSSWHTILVGGENAGGNSIYALDVTNPATLSNETNLANAALWEFTDSDMGLSYSTPQIAQIKTSAANFAVFFGNGYNSPGNSSVLYAVNAQTGSLIKKIDLCTIVNGACDSTLPQGLSSVAIGQKDGLQGQPITTVYAGDLQGNLWAIDVSDATPANWTARRLFKATDSSGAKQAITTPPVVTLNPSYPRKQGLFVMFGTGRLLITSDLLDTQTQTIYGIWDRPSANTTFTRGSLQQQTLTLIPTSVSNLTVPIVTVTSAAVNWANKVGWFDDLPTAGARLITDPALSNGAFIATINTPPTTVCGTAFSSMLLELNFLNGGAFARPILDIKNEGVIGTNSTYNGANPVGMGIANTFANAPTLVGVNQNNYMVILITKSNGTQATVINPNNAPRKIGWWQLQ